MTAVIAKQNELTKEQRDGLVESVRGFLHKQSRIYHRKYGHRRGIPYDEFLSACQLAVVKASRTYDDSRGCEFCTWAGRIMSQHSMFLVRWWEKEKKKVVFSDVLQDVAEEEIKYRDDFKDLVAELMDAIRYEFGDQQASAFYEYYAERKPLGELRRRYGHCFNVKNTVRRMRTCASVWLTSRNIDKDILR